MGVSTSSNTIDSMIKDSINVINNYSQVCAITATGAANLISVTGCILENVNILEKNQLIINSSCITNASNQVAISSVVSQSMNQSAQAATSLFDFGNVTAAKNFIDATVELADTISNTFNSTCASKLSAGTNTFVCQGSTIKNSVFTFDNYESITQECILNVVNVSEAYTKAVSSLQDSAVAKNESVFSILALVFVSILAIGAWFIINVATDPFYQWLVVGIVLFFTLSAVIYTITAKNSGNYPFKKP